jgi:cyclohexanone monooxygenase
MNSQPEAKQLDAVIVGAGFSGIYMLHKLKNELGLAARVIEKAGGVGGTWYRNTYPGALSDSAGHLYCYSFDDSLLLDWDWESRYSAQPNLLAYLGHVVERYGLGADIRLNTTVESARFQEDRGEWEVRCDTGEVLSARFLVTGVGTFQAPVFPDIPGLETFEAAYHTSNWPTGVDLAGQRVGVIGTGSSGTQVITSVAPVAAQLTVFQRTPQYCVPSGNHVLTAAERNEIKRNYKKIWDDAYQSKTGFGHVDATMSAMSVSEDERMRVFEEAWQRGGGFNFLFGTFNDLIDNAAANEAAAAFIRNKIRQIVQDEGTARKLTPTQPYARRPVCDSGYYATFNRPNVSLVDIKDNPIAEVTPTGVRTSDGVLHELDVLVFATGFDAFVGSYERIDIRGREETSLNEHWSAGISSYLGLAMAGFPNLFMLHGPYAAFSNGAPLISTQVEWVGELIATMRDRGLTSAEATPEAEQQWVDTCNSLVEGSIVLEVDSWIVGANVPGRPRRVLYYLPGLAAYRETLTRVAQAGYSGFQLTASPAVEPDSCTPQQLASSPAASA